MRVDVAVLGAGMVGVSAALHLAQRGRSVALVDRLGAPAGETSYGNTGIVQSEVAFPYTFPRRPGEILRAALNLDPRAHVRYSALPSIAPFLLRYFLASSPRRRQESGRGLRSLVSRATAEHRAFASAAGALPLLRGGGWIKAFRTLHGRDEVLRDAEQAGDYQIPYRSLDREALLALEPNVGPAAIGGVHFPDPLTTGDPAALTASYAALLVAKGGRLLQGDATTLAEAPGGFEVQTEMGALSAHEVVLALGPWTDALARSLGYRFPFGVKRGYHMHYDAPGEAWITRPVLDYERGYVVTPMEKGLRLTTGAEFAAVNDAPSTAHLDRLEPFGREMFGLGARLEPAPWLGRRPCLPDMLPVIGRASRHNGLWFDFGHQHLGLTLGPISGRLLAELMTGESPSIDPTPFRAERFG